MRGFRQAGVGRVWVGVSHFGSQNWSSAKFTLSGAELRATPNPGYFPGNTLGSPLSPAVPGFALAEGYSYSPLVRIYG